LRHYNVRIAPRTFFAWLGRGPSRRALWDTTITEILAGYYEPDERGRRRPESLYGAVKMWAHLNRQGIPVARCTVERLMRGHGWAGVRRGRRVRTTITDPRAGRALDLVGRQFVATAPNQLLVADFTYVRIRSGFCYVAFVVDAYAGTIIGWDVIATADAAMVERALADALQARRRQGHPIGPGAIHHSDAGSQGGFQRSSQHLDHGGVLGWDGSRGRRRYRQCRWAVGGSGLRIGRYGRRCVHRGGRSPRVLCSVRSGV